LDAELLDEEERDFVQTALEATLAGPVEQIERAGEDARAVVTSATTADAGLGVPLEEEAGAGSEEATADGD
jgi:hypothetical protein